MRHKKVMMASAALLGGVSLAALSVTTASAQLWPAVAISIGWPEILAAGAVYCIATDCLGVNQAQAGTPKPPAPGQTGGNATSGRELTIPVGYYNQCEYDITANGHVFQKSVFDSGAAGHLTFGKNHARDLGFDPGKLSYSHTYGSANGVGHEAKVTIQELKIGNWTLRDVPAVITAANQDQVLVGLEILRPLNFRLTKTACYVSLPQAAVMASLHPSPSPARPSEPRPSVPSSIAPAPQPVARAANATKVVNGVEFSGEEIRRLCGGWLKPDLCKQLEE
jgi:clan AA aspartic protease (TIGR02281 family)